MNELAPWDTWEWDVPPGTTAETLAEQAERETTVMLAAARSLPLDVLERPGAFDKWSGRDVVAHCVAWAEICCRILGQLADGSIDLHEYRELPVGDETGDALNERQVEELRSVPIAELFARLDDAGRGVAGALRGSDVDPPAELVLLTVGDHLAEHAKDLRGLLDD
ncbi:MAG TPA: maleylpyruvate isomerase N-terminal domain-containing protein [Actinomycetota bacterium]